MKTLASFIALFCAFAAPALAQAPSPEAAAERRAAIERLDFMVGEFRGDGWVVGQDRVRRTFTHHERAETRAGGLVMTVEGAATSPEDSPGAPGFQAFGVISWNDEADRYEMQTYAYGRGYSVAGALTAENAFQWGFSPNAAVDIRYTITAPTPGTWREIGEVSTDDGATWVQFFEMNLAAVDAATE
ncbi:MAG: hypothetical protein GC206_10295 [Alphaproteobacteria bacterium]|nr:hypothetical protein [Alphaproteobacteria bacterium]